MEDVIIDLDKSLDISNAMVILGFPTVGLIGSIAGNYIAHSLELEQVGYINSKYFFPAVIIRDSKPVPPVRIYYASKDICGDNGNCDRLVAIISELPIPPKAIYPLVHEILKWIDDRGISMFLGLEGIKSDERKQEDIDVYGIGSTDKMIDILNKHDIEPTKNGVITGFCGALLDAVVRNNKDMLCILTEAHYNYPDSRAAGRLLEKVDDLLPSAHLNLGPLYDKAEKIENNIRHVMKQSQSTTQLEQITAPQMYG